jgi:hypothetical protein
VRTPLAVSIAVFVASIAGSSAALSVQITPITMTGDPLMPVALPGQQAPDAPAGVTIAHAFVREMIASGRIGYQASFQTGVGGVTSNDNLGLYVDDPSAGGTLQVRDGDPAPGMAGHRLVLDAIADSFPQWNAGGELVFASVAIPSPIVFPFPGVAGGFFDWIPGGGSFDLDPHGRLAFAAQMLAGLGAVATATDWGIWVADGPGDITLRHRAGQPAPDTTPGAVFGSFDTPALNGAGELAFVGSLEFGPGGVTNLSDGVIYGPDGTGGLRLLARVGDSVDLGGGDVRIFQTLLQFDSSPDLRHTAVSAIFGDGSSGLFLITIPEPGTGVLLAAGLVAAAWAKRSHLRKRRWGR